MLKKICGRLPILLLLVLTSKALVAAPVIDPAKATGSKLTPGPISFPSGFMPSVKTYGAVGDGKTDDTAAIQRALADGRSSPAVDYFGRPKALYFPPGVYLVKDTLKWIGCCVTLQGAGTSSSTLRLMAGAPGFGDPVHPKPLIITPGGNESFRQNIWDLQIEIGANNPGATAVDYVSNNSGSVHDVLIRSDDGKAHTGIDLTRAWAGPLLVKNTEIDGFGVGLDLSGNEYSSTFESITLKHQTVAGIRNVKEPISVRNLFSVNAVPALTNNAGFVVLLDANLTGGTSATSAIQSNATTYLRNIASSGYAATLADSSTGSTKHVTGSISELTVGSRRSLNGDPASGSLNLNVEDTPSYTSSPIADAAAFTTKFYGDTSSLQELLNSGKSTIYFPFGTYFSKREVSIIVPDTVHRIVGFSSIVFGDAEGYNGGGIKLIVSSNNQQPLFVEQLNGLKISHQGSRPLVIKNADVTYTNVTGAGDLFLEDVLERVPLVVRPGQNVWARQLNDEVAGTKILNKGGALWILGLKTENAGTVINTTGGGRTELLGALIYPTKATPATNIAFLSIDSDVSYMYMQNVYNANWGYSIQVEEIRSGHAQKIVSSPSARFLMPLFVGFD